MLDLHLDPAKNLLTTRVAGVVGVGELATKLYQAIRDPKFSSGMNGLIVALDNDAIPDPGRFSLLKPVLKVWITQRTGARWALVAPTELARDRAEALLVELKLGGAIRCFTSEAAAVAWLQEASVAFGEAFRGAAVPA